MRFEPIQRRVSFPAVGVRAALRFRTTSAA
jgi:hypothetical protein